METFRDIDPASPDRPELGYNKFKRYQAGIELSMTAYDLTQTPNLWFERLLSLDPDYVSHRIEDFLNEDLPEGDATTQATVAPDIQAQAELVANQALVFAGEQVLPHIFGQSVVQLLVHDGEAVTAGTVLARLRGPARELLIRERVMLNLLQRLCGIATLTREYTKLPAPAGFKILDTRKTTPGLRLFEKYAVAVAGAYNHRLDLSSVIMIKDNHLVAAGGIPQALAKVRAENIRELFVELEVDNLTQLDEALELGGFDAFLLDNMPPETIREAVNRVRTHPKGGMRIFLEASGGITRDSLA
ncbi:MAG: nicotinate-nucleotide diphosphorylase (carboxylating), partial [Candidatus Melainabacteria bacterium HGW-Melainabacteria-1]